MERSLRNLCDLLCARRVKTQLPPSLFTQKRFREISVRRRSAAAHQLPRTSELFLAVIAVTAQRRVENVDVAAVQHHLALSELTLQFLSERRHTMQNLRHMPRATPWAHHLRRFHIFRIHVCVISHIRHSRRPPRFRKQHRHAFRILRFPHRSSHLLKYLYFPSSLNFLDITESKSHPVVRSARRAAPEPARPVSRKHPHNRPPSHADVARLSEASERYVVCRLPRSTFHGIFRKICHSQTTLRHSSRTLPQNRPPKRYLRHSSRKHPQAMPQNAHIAT